jgi:hypothetical protein
MGQIELNSGTLATVTPGQLGQFCPRRTKDRLAYSLNLTLP